MTNTVPPFLRIVATYPPGKNLPDSLAVEFNVSDGDDQEEIPGDGFSPGFARFVGDVAAGLARVAAGATLTAVNVFVAPEDATVDELSERLRRLGGLPFPADFHVPGCDGLCNEKPAGAPGSEQSGAVPAGTDAGDPASADQVPSGVDAGESLTEADERGHA